MSENDPPAFHLLPDGDEIELPSPDEQQAEPRQFGRGRKLAAAVVAVAVVAAGLTLQRHRALDAERRQQAAALSAAAAASAAAGQSPAAVVDKQPWPSIPGGCGETDLVPVVSSAPLTEHSGIRLTVGGAGLFQVDVDSGKVTPVAGVSLPTGTQVLDHQLTGLAPNQTRYLTTTTCSSGAQVLRVGSGPATALAQPYLLDLLPDGIGGIWSSQVDLAGTNLSNAAFQVDLVRLTSRLKVPLPANYLPVAVHRNTLVATSAAVNPATTPQKLVLYDLRSHRITRQLGPAISITQSQGLLAWTSQACSTAGPCPLHIYDLATGQLSVRGYSLPVESSITSGAFSPDHQRLAFALPRMSDDPRYYSGSAGEPSDLVILDLRTGVLEPVPNLEIAPQSTVSLAFSADSRWLVAGVPAAGGPKLLLWRSGLTAPLASSARLPGPTSAPLLLQLAR